MSAQDNGNDRREFTVVYRNLTPEEVSAFMDHPKSIYVGWCHAPHERDEAREALFRATGERS